MTSSEYDTIEISPVSEGTPGMFVPRGPATRATFGAASHVGNVRENNEDHFAVVRRTRSREILLTNVDVANVSLPDDHAHTLIVADGVGGRGFGELASEFVVRFGWELVGRSTSWLMKFENTHWDEIRSRVEAYVNRIQAALQDYAESEPKLAGMGTTWTCVYVMNSDAILAHVGDSRAYLYRQGALQQLTRDHTFAQDLIDIGMPPHETAPFKHVLTNSFAARSEKVVPQIEHVPLEGRDRLLVCTDGLTDMVPDAEIAAVLQRYESPQTTCDRLIDLALRRGGKDNVTVVVADFEVGDESKPQGS